MPRPHLRGGGLVTFLWLHANYFSTTSDIAENTCQYATTSARWRSNVWHVVSCQFATTIKPEEPAECDQTLFSQVGSWHETNKLGYQPSCDQILHCDWSALYSAAQQRSYQALPSLIPRPHPLTEGAHGQGTRLSLVAGCGQARLPSFSGKLSCILHLCMKAWKWSYTS